MFELPRLTIALTFDPDALSDGIRRGDPQSSLDRGEFGIRVGVPRILGLLERERIEATWFVPGHTLVTFPDAVTSIVAGGHEVGAHGWYHEDLAELSIEEQRSIFDRSRDAIANVTGAPPTGIRAPYWSTGPESLKLIEAAGFLYDSSLMGGDLQPYRVRHGDRHSVADGTGWGRPGRLLEVPISTALNDWYHFEPGPARDGLSAPSKVLEIWRDELRFAWENEPGGIVTITMHPECIGHGHRMLMLEEFIRFAGDLDGVVFGRIDRYVQTWLARDTESPAADVLAPALTR
jgi:peptidoglycan/xylan/chitin deacetylase (PgdA/CDA1 family)